MAEKQLHSENPFKKQPKGQPDVAEPKHSARKVKGFVDLAPMAYNMKEAVDERLDQLIRLGLGDPGHIAFFRQALANPKQSVQSAAYRDYVAHALSVLLQLILSDQVLFQRVRTTLQNTRNQLTIEEVITQAMQLRQESAVDVNPTSQKTVHKKHPRPAKVPGPK